MLKKANLGTWKFYDKVVLKSFQLNAPMNRNPQLSIIMPVYNCEKYVTQAITSIIQQTFIDWELLICDDASTDNSLEVIHTVADHDERIRCYSNDRNLGKTKTVNALYEECNGQYITVHDSDDISMPSRFQLQIEYLEVNRGCSFLGTNFITVLKDGDEFSRSKMLLSYDQIKHQLHKSSQYHGPTIVFRRSALDKLSDIYRQYFQNNFEDVDLCLRLISQDEFGDNLSQHLYKYRILKDSLCRREYTARNRSLFKLAYHFYQQRIEYGGDDLDMEKIDKIENYIDELNLVYKKDPSLIFREAASYYNYWRLYDKSLEYSFKGLVKEPFNIKNLTTFLYCLKLLIRDKNS